VSAEADLRNHIAPILADEGVKAFNIGRKIRDLRKGKALTLQDLSTATGLSKPLLSQIENEIVVPPISTLLKISRALDKDIAFFFQEPNDDRKIVVVRTFERESLDTRKLGRTDGGYSYESLAYKKSRKNMEPFLVEFERKDEKEMSFYSHEGEEFLFVLEGDLEFRTRDEVHGLKKGDSLYFESDVPHSYRALGKKNAKAIVVIFSTP
jgi:transcriptional regulator with XRE-family HTH domain